MRLPKTRAEAIAHGLTQYYTGKPCERGHIAERRIDTGCMECSRIRWAEYFKTNRQKEQKRQAKAFAANPEKFREKWAKSRKANPETMRGIGAKWAKANPEARRMSTALRHAWKLQATPSWFTKEHKAQIADIYEQAVLAEQLTGVKHHVDHIEPLQGEDRCGLHVPWNLQILEATENLSKGNRAKEAGG